MVYLAGEIIIHIVVIHPFFIHHMTNIWAGIILASNKWFFLYFKELFKKTIQPSSILVCQNLKLGEIMD